MRGSYATALMAALLGGTSAFAQTVQPAPVRQSVDDNGVDLFYGTLNISRQDASIGTRDQGLSYSRIWRDGAWVDNFDIHIFQAAANTVTVTTGGVAESFTGSGIYANAQGGGSTLTRSGSSTSYVYTYTTADGAIYTFNKARGYSALSSSDLARIVSVVSPDGAKQSYAYTDISYGGATISRLASVTTNFGYKVDFAYAASSPQASGGVNAFYTISGVTLSNLANGATQSSSYSAVTSATDSAGRSWAYQISGGKITDIQRPGHSTDIHIDYYSGNGRVWMYRDPTNIVTSYNYSDGNGERTTTIQVGGNAPSQAVFDLNTQMMKRSIDELGHVTRYEYDNLGRMKKLIANDGNSVEYIYDTRGNITTTIAHPKPGALFSSGAPMTDVSTTAVFPGSCDNPKTCNKPVATVDGRGAQTDYTYEPNAGLLETLTMPAGSNGVRPQVRYGFTAFPTSWGDGGEIRQVTSISTCRTQPGWPAGSQPSQPSCAGTSDATVTEIEYEAASANMAPKRVWMHAGDQSVSTDVRYGYDSLRNLTRVTDALGKDTLLGYSAGREPLWMLSPDPDGAGSLKNRMVVTDRYPDGSVQALKTGTANADGSGFSELQRTQYGYDAAGRKVWEYVDVAGARTSQVEYSYDGLGRLDCTNQRMNFDNMTNVFGRIAVCDLSENGGWGSDRITRTEYDAASRITRTWAGYRTDNAYHTDYNWTNNNKLERLIDPKGMATTYYYDGFDRQRYTCFVTMSCASAGIYEELFYDSNGNVIDRRQRDGSKLNYQYDALNRPTVLTATAANNAIDRVTRYSYDNDGRVTKAAVDNASYLDVRYTYGGLGRLIKEASDVALLSVDFGYDATGRLNYIGYGDGYWVDYDYYYTGEMYQVREKGATSGGGVLAQIGIDNLGRRTSLVRGDGSREDRVYSQGGNGPWMIQLTQAMAGAGFARSFNVINPAGQILSRSDNNNNYAWTQFGNVDRSYSVNGLNQYTQSGSITLGYDGRGNLTSAPSPITGSNGNPSTSASFVYNTQNMMISANGVGFNYDAVGRLSMDSTTSSNRRFGYGGSRMLTERKYDDTFVNRYVYGPDEAPIVVYEGSGTGSKRYLVGDERGSVVALTNGQGSVDSLYKYDEFGIPAANASNLSRFGYTGQAWNATMGMWYYKARIYSPTLGRFMQTDPIGYEDGINWYNYVGSDPVNGTDPSGMAVKDLDGCALGDPGICSGSPGAAPDITVRAIYISRDLLNLDGSLRYNQEYITPAERLLPQRGTLLRRAYRWFNPDPCSGKGTNEGAGVPAGIDPYKVDEGGSLGSLFGHVLPDHDFGGSFADSRFLTGAILTTILTNPVRASGGSVRYTVNTGQFVGYDRANQANTDYLTVIMGPPSADGSRALRTAYPGCPKAR